MYYHRERGDAAMDVDKDKTGMQPVKKSKTTELMLISFSSMTRNLKMDLDSPEVLTPFDKQMETINGEIEKMAPNLKAKEGLGNICEHLLLNLSRSP